MARELNLSKAERQFHRRNAARAFNQAWDYLDMKNRSPEDDIQMLHLAHASRYHWSFVGTRRNQAVGEWQLSRIYSDLGQPDLALRFARLSLSTCRRNGLREIEPTANEAIARAYAVARDPQRAKKYLAKARRQVDMLTLDKEDREIYLGQISDTQRLINGL